MFSIQLHFDLSKKLSFFCVIFVNAYSVKVGIFSRNLQCTWSLLWSISLKDTWVMLYKMPEIRSNLFLKRWVLVLLPLYVLCKAQELAWISFKYFIVVHVSNRKEWKSCTRNPIFGFCNSYSKYIYIRIIKIYGWSIFLIPLIPFAKEFTPLTILKTVFIHYSFKYIHKITI